MLFGTLGASLLGDLLTKKLSRKGTVRAGKGIKRKALISPSPHLLTNIEIINYYNGKKGFNGVFSRDNLLKKIKNGAYVINPGEYTDVGTHWIALYVKNNEITYFDFFGVEHVPKEIIMHPTIEHKNIKTNIFRIQTDNSVMCGHFCIEFIDFIFAGRSLIEFTSFFSPYDFKKNDKIILAFFK